MGHIRVLICRVDDPASDHMTQLAAFDLPAPDPTALQSATALDKLETTMLTPTMSGANFGGQVNLPLTSDVHQHHSIIFSLPSATAHSLATYIEQHKVQPHRKEG
jgi:hypothetical protein